MTDLSKKGRELRGKRGKIHIFNGHPSEIWEIVGENPSFFSPHYTPHPHEFRRPPRTETDEGCHAVSVMAGNGS